MVFFASMKMLRNIEYRVISGNAEKRSKHESIYYFCRFYSVNICFQMEIFSDMFLFMNVFTIASILILIQNRPDLYTSLSFVLCLFSIVLDYFSCWRRMFPLRLGRWRSVTRRWKTKEQTADGSGGSRIHQTGGANPKGGGVKLIFWQILLENYLDLPLMA